MGNTFRTENMSQKNNSARLRNDLMRTAAAEVENLKAYKTAGSKIFDRVLKWINPRTSFSISRQLIAGSTGKNTSLGHNFEPDFDVILFVRNVTHLETLKPVIEEFHEILKNLPSESEDWTRFKIHRWTNYGVQFSMETVIELPEPGRKKPVTISFDLLPAYDFHSNVDQQRFKVLEKINMSRDREGDNYKYSGSLSEKTVEIVNKKSDFVHCVIRLAKLWDKKLKDDLEQRDGEWKISGRSSIIELIAIQTANESGGNILEALRKFLERMMNLNKIKINFSEQDYHRNSAMMIIDAVNPYHNYADGLTTTHVNDYAARASKSLRALANVEKSDFNYDKALEDFMADFAKA
ncbi:unnamed protein product [Allacma fusca]|uniref:Nucleotidyltransferase n=1 Tax=Allacma fusca TaxID=39272 RepID=A0A8J2JEW6_9HEXA|nr:unnamed protein product [Allacma fusca]